MFLPLLEYHPAKVNQLALSPVRRMMSTQQKLTEGKEDRERESRDGDETNSEQVEVAVSRNQYQTLWSIEQRHWLAMVLLCGGAVGGRVQFFSFRCATNQISIIVGLLQVLETAVGMDVFCNCSRQQLNVREQRDARKEDISLPSYLAGVCRHGRNETVARRM